MSAGPPDRNGSLLGRRIGLLTASVSRLGGGVGEAVIRQADLIRDIGGEPVIIALADRHSREDRDRHGSIDLIELPVRGPAQIGYAPQLVPALIRAELDCLHLHGIWMYPSRAGALWARHTNRPYLISPHAMLAPRILERNRWKKALARIGYEHSSWRSARAFHALTGTEATDIAAATGREAGIVIPNPAPDLAPARTAPPARQRYAYLGRIHPKKNILSLVEAWEQLAGAGSLAADAELIIAGWGDPADVISLSARIARSPPSLRFAGPVFGSAKQELLSGARALILPSFGEGLPMVALESWSAGTPLLMSDLCNLPQGFSAGAAIDCGISPERIAKAIASMARLDSEGWSAMSEAARGLAGGPFSAAAIADRWGTIYSRAIAGQAVEGS